MTKSLASIRPEVRLRVAMRRTQIPKDAYKGNGYWAAVDFLRATGARLPDDKQHAQQLIQSAMVSDIKEARKNADK